MYSFTTDGLGVATANMSAAQNALSLINVVPNPYYAYSGYETDRLDTKVRITNLPPKCTISIFTISLPPAAFAHGYTESAGNIKQPCEEEYTMGAA